MRPRSGSTHRILGDDPEIFVGQELSGYTIRRKLAQGDTAMVYEGVHDKIGRSAAIKVLRLEFCRSEDMVERFYQEARAVNSIRHENIVDIHDFGRDPHGRVFFVMEYLDGEPLSARIGRGALTWSEAFPILEQTLRALKAVHDKGFVHRDLKPANIWLRPVDGRTQVKLLDFGIAKLVGVDSAPDRLPRTGAVVGAPHYMSPEQINGSRDIDRRTDVYALGAIMYEMFAGVAPFVGDTAQAVMSGHLFREPPRLTGLRPQLGVPAAIAEIVDLMLVKDAAGRYQSATDLLADLHDVNNQRLPSNAATLTAVRDTRARAAIPALVAPARKTARRAPAILGAAAVAAAIAGVALWWSQHRAVEVPVTVPPCADALESVGPAAAAGPATTGAGAASPAAAATVDDVLLEVRIALDETSAACGYDPAERHLSRALSRPRSR